jgi:hypothetical protein
MVADSETLSEQASHLADTLFEQNGRERDRFVTQLLRICESARDKDILLIHNPGGWGSTNIEGLLQWERSIVEGTCESLQKLGYNCAVTQYFRSNTGMPAVIGDIREQTRFFINKSKLMAAAVEFIMQHFDKLKIVLVGVSQGAAFSNAVIQRLDGHNRILDIELGMPSPYHPKRVLTERTLALNNNGLMPDALMEWNVPVIMKTYFSAPFRFVRHRLRGEEVKFTYCINVPGHDYNWDYPEVQKQIENFLEMKLGIKRQSEVKRK